MTDVFISYKRRLRPRVELLASGLESLGVDVWYDAELEPGSTFSATISQHVRGAKCVLVCWSNDVFHHGGDRHGWVLGEATIGRERGVLVAAMLEKSDLDPPWNTVHAEDLKAFGTKKSDQAAVGWRNILLAIGRHVGRPGLADYDRALASHSDAVVLAWAKRYPQDPSAVSILAAHNTSALENEVDNIAALRRRSAAASVGRAGLVLVPIALLLLLAVWQAGFINLDALRGIAPSATSKTNASSTSSEQLATSSSQPNTLQSAADAASVDGAQSLLLEASDDGSTGAVPFSGTIQWRQGSDDFGNPTIVGSASVPGRGLSMEILARKNADPSLPAGQLLEITFTVPRNFKGGSIAALPGVLLKDEELVQGVPLVGAPARIVGNSFLFALSSDPQDVTANVNLLNTRKWIDIALTYASGKRAILTLEKDDVAMKLFSGVLAKWMADAYVAPKGSLDEAAMDEAVAKAAAAAAEEMANRPRQPIDLGL